MLPQSSQMCWLMAAIEKGSVCTYHMLTPLQKGFRDNKWKSQIKYQLLAIATACLIKKGYHMTDERVTWGVESGSPRSLVVARQGRCWVREKSTAFGQLEGVGSTKLEEYDSALTHQIAMRHSTASGTEKGPSPLASFQHTMDTESSLKTTRSVA